MAPLSPPETETNSPPQAGKFQISISTMLLLMVVFSLMAAGIYHASRVPAITQELNIWFGWEAAQGEKSGRMLQLTFIMFTYSMPLLMAGLLATMSSLFSWWNRRR